MPPVIPPNMLDPQTPIYHIRWETKINIAKLPPTPKNMSPNTDAPVYDDPNAADNDADDYPDAAAYPKYINLSLINRNRNHNLHNHPLYTK